MKFIAKTKIILSSRKSLLSGAIAGVAFILLYLVSIEHLSFTVKGFSFFMVDNPLTRALVMRAPFMWEPIASLSFFGIQLFISPLNIIVGLILAALVFLNIAVAVFSYAYRKVCSSRPGYSIAGILPAMFSGFACCVPTFIITLAPVLGSLTVFFVQIQPYMLPLSLILMSYSLFFSVSRLPLSQIIVAAR